MFAVPHNNKYPSVGVKVCAFFIAIFQMFTTWQMSCERVNNMSSFILNRYSTTERRI